MWHSYNTASSLPKIVVRPVQWSRSGTPDGYQISDGQPGPVAFFSAYRETIALIIDDLHELAACNALRGELIIGCVESLEMPNSDELWGSLLPKGADETVFFGRQPDPETPLQSRVVSRHFALAEIKRLCRRLNMLSPRTAEICHTDIQHRNGQCQKPNQIYETPEARDWCSAA